MQFLFKQNISRAIYLGVFSALFSVNQSLAFTIKKSVKISWLSTKEAKNGKNTPDFKNSYFDKKYGSIPIFKEKLGNCGTEIKNYSIKNLVLEDENSLNQDFEKIKNTELKLEIKVGVEQRQPILFVEFIPFIRNLNQIKRVISFDVEFESTNEDKSFKSVGKKSSNNSVLSSGVWYKIATLNNAVFKIDYPFLKNLGINPDLIDPRNIKIFGNGAGMLPEKNNAFRYDDLEENAIFVQGESDGKFNVSDFVLFYGESQKEHWIYNSASKFYNCQPNLYSDTTYYFLHVANTPGKRIPAVESNTSFNYTTNSFDDLQHHEEDLVNFVKTGRNWYGEDFNKQPQRNFTNIINQFDSSEEIQIQSSAAGRASQRNEFDMSVNNVSLINHSFYALSLSYDDVYADLNVKTASFKTQSNRLDITYTYNGPIAQSANGWLDYYTINARAFLVNSGTPFKFSDKKSIATGNSAKFEIKSNRNLTIWDVSNPTKVFSVKGSFDIATSKFSFNVNTDSLRTFVAFDGTNFNKPIPIGSVANQNIHGLGPAQGIIISHNLFLDEARRLASFHKQKNGLTVHVINVSDIYNEFGGGSQDVSAIRDMLKMFYDKYTSNNEKLKYVTFFGRASYDYKGNTLKTNANFVNSNYLPTYQEFNSTYPSSFCTDDFFVCLDDNEGNFLNNRDAADLMDLGIGRLPVSTSSEAKELVDKIIYYQSKSSFGDWRNRVTFITDDEWTEYYINFMGVAENLITTNFTPIKKLNVQKIYSNSYQPITTAGGKRFPEVNLAISNAVNKGSLVINYIGHGGEVGWSARRILNVAEINAWNAKENMPLFMTATCEFSRFDDPNRVAAGELALLNPNGGAIALFTTVRIVYASDNDRLNEKFNTQLGIDSNAILNPKSFGQIMMDTKNLFPTGNTRNFTLLGDPMLKIALPRYNIKTTTINNKPIASFNDTIKALSKVTLTGEILDQNNQLISDFNGIAYTTILDKESEYPIVDKEKPLSLTSFKLQNNVIFTGSATVVNGKFSFNFIVPKDIDYKFGLGKISYYAHSDSVDASGYSTSLVGGTSDSAFQDNKGPEIKLYFNDEKFVNGGATNENSLFIAKISDENGINLTGKGIGRDLNAVINNENKNTIVLNDFYQTEINSYQKGTVNYPFKDLPLGQNKIKFQAFDALNNLGEAEIDFLVVSNSNLAIKNILNYPNPFVNKTTFHFDHNKAGSEMQVLIQIFTVSGKLVKSFQKDIIASKSHFDEIEWDGKDDFGDIIGKGVYIYKVKVKSQGKSEEAFEKLVILR